MTAEIAVMNRHAVALAADSAVTITTPAGQKIFNTVNKLFTLSKYNPIGVMIHGSADVAGIPWELAVKLYRRSIGRTAFATVEEAAEHFMDWLAGNFDLFPEELREAMLIAEVRVLFAAVLDAINLRVQVQINEAGEIDEPQLIALIDEELRKMAELVDAFPYCVGCNDDVAGSILERYQDPLDAEIERSFEDLPLSDEQRSELLRMASAVACKDHGVLDSSGLVIAGFGEDQPFPALIAFDVVSVVHDFVKRGRRGDARVSPEMGATIFPFAQREMVDTFMGGIDPSYREALDGFLGNLLGGYPDEILGALPEIPEGRREELRAALLAIGEDVQQRIADELDAFKQARFVEPIVASVSVLPKDELAEMAEALVNLTSFKRRMSIGEVETVGGPIDVAVISKGDGFIWIKRKHYFDAAKNPQFTARYFDEGSAP